MTRVPLLAETSQQPLPSTALFHVAAACADGIERLTLWIYLQFVNHPKRVRGILMVVMLVAAIGSFGGQQAHAAPPAGSSAGTSPVGGGFDAGSPGTSAGTSPVGGGFSAGSPGTSSGDGFSAGSPGASAPVGAPQQQCTFYFFACHAANTPPPVCTGYIFNCQPAPNAAGTSTSGGGTSASTGFFGDIETYVSGITGSWMDGAMNLAMKLFLAMFFFTLIYNIVKQYLEFQSMRGMVMIILKTMLSLGLPYTILVFVSSQHLFVLSNFRTLASQVSGSIMGGNTYLDSTPANILKIGVTYSHNILAAAWTGFTHNWPSYFFGPSILVNLALLIVVGVLSFCILLVFFVLAVEVLVASLEVLFVLPLAAWTLGFTGSPGTASFGSGFWHAALKTLVRFITIYAVVYFASQLSSRWNTTYVAQITNWIGFDQTGVTNFMTLVNICMTMLIDLLGLAFLIIKLPALVSAAVSGGAALSGVGIIGGAVGAAAGGVAGAAHGFASGGGPLGAAAGGLAGAYTGSQRGAAHGVESLHNLANQQRSSGESKASQKKRDDQMDNIERHLADLNNKIP